MYCQLQPYACFPCSVASPQPCPGWAWGRKVPCSQACMNRLWEHLQGVSRPGWTMFLSQEGIRGPHCARSWGFGTKTPPFQLGRKRGSRANSPRASWRRLCIRTSCFLSFCWCAHFPPASPWLPSSWNRLPCNQHCMRAWGPGWDARDMGLRSPLPPCPPSSHATQQPLPFPEGFPRPSFAQL